MTTPARYGNMVLSAARRVRVLRILHGAWMYLVRIVERMEDNHIFISAAAIAFNTLLCLIPLVLIMLTVLGLTLNAEQAMVAISNYFNQLDLVPFQRERLLTFALGIVREFTATSSLTGIIGGVALLYTASALFSAVRAALNRVYAVRDTRNLVLAKLKDMAMLSLLGVGMIAVTVVLAAAALVQNLAADVFGSTSATWPWSALLSTTSTATLTFLLLLLVFTLVPDRRLPWRAVVLSSGVATVLWTVAKLVFGYYLTHLWSIGVVYGPYAVAVAFAVWLYYSSVTLLLAAEVGEMYIERRSLRELFSEDRMRAVISHLRAVDLRSTQSARSGD